MLTYRPVSMEPRPILWHLVVSHYSEKVRWALDHKWIPYNGCAQPPGVHIAVAAWLTRGRQFTLPVLQLEGRRIGDSTAIIAALEKRFGEPPLYPADPDERAHALELEEWFDEELGPAARRFAFHEAPLTASASRSSRRRSLPHPSPGSSASTERTAAS